MFLVTQFLATEAVGKNSNTLADRRLQFSSIRESTFKNGFALHFKVKFDQLFVHRVLRSRLTSNLQIKKRENSAPISQGQFGTCWAVLDRNWAHLISVSATLKAALALPLNLALPIAK